MREPSLDIYHQTTLPNRFFTWLAATRPAFFTASVFSILCALALAWSEEAVFKEEWALLTVLAMILFHAGANVLNDYYDIHNDNGNQERIYPFSGGSRFIQNNVLSAAETFWLGAFLLLGGVIIGIWMIWLTGVTLLWIGLAGGVLAVFYSAPPCLACRGLGDVTIALAFGVLPVAGTVWIQLGEIPVSAWWLGVIVGIFTAAILWVNSLPDLLADRRAGKHTLPVRLGEKYAPYGLAVLFALGFALILFAPLPDGMHWGMLALVPALAAVHNVLQGKLLPTIPLVLLTHAVVCLMMAMGSLL